MAELETILAAKALAAKPKARQWRFFRDAVCRLVSGSGASEFDTLSRVQSAQLKFEVDVFTLVHESELPAYGVEDAAAYPRLAGYGVLVRDLAEERVGERAVATEDVRPYLERVVSACVDAEFAAYSALPEIKLDEVARCFCANSPAYREIANLVSRHSQRGWVISNPLNPSTKRLLALKVNRLAGREALVATTEYWYLRWWGTKEKSYVYPYRETNHQLLVLRKEPDDGWRVYENLRPAPRSSAPARWHQRRHKLVSGTDNPQTKPRREDDV